MPEEDHRHVQVSFYSQPHPIPGTCDAVVDVPISADWEQLNTLVNTLATTANEDWKEKRFELLIGSTFLRSSLDEFIEENHVDVERVVKIECVSGYDPPNPFLGLSGPDWISSVHVTEKLFISTSYNGEVTVWDRAGKQLGSSAMETGAVKAAAIIESPKRGTDGLKMANGGESGTVWIQEWDSACSSTASACLRGHARSVEAVAVGVKGTRLLSGSFDTTIKIWNLQADNQDIIEVPASKETKKKKSAVNCITKTPMVTLCSHSDAVVAVEWSPEREERAFSASWDHSILQWDLELAGEVSRIRGQRAFTSIHVHPSTLHLLASSTDALPRLYDPRSSEGSFVKQSFVGHKGWVSKVRWTGRDEHSFISSSYDQTVKMWDIRSSKTAVFDLSGHEDRVLCCESAHGAILSGGVDTKINIFNF